MYKGKVVGVTNQSGEDEEGLPRRMGKTTRLIEHSKDHNGYIVCMTSQEAHRIFKQAQDMGLKINFPITFDEFLAGDFCGKNISSFVIDNADYLIQRLARGVEVKYISLTKELP